jgi:hypothetical protein
LLKAWLKINPEAKLLKALNVEVHLNVYLVGSTLRINLNAYLLKFLVDLFLIIVKELVSNKKEQF